MASPSGMPFFIFAPNKTCYSTEVRSIWRRPTVVGNSQKSYKNLLILILRSSYFIIKSYLCTKKYDVEM